MFIQTRDYLLEVTENKRKNPVTSGRCKLRLGGKDSQERRNGKKVARMVAGRVVDTGFGQQTFKI